MNSELQHYGIKGQKWGVRRFQNEDGSLTPAGKERYDDDQEKKSSTIFTKRNILIGAAAVAAGLAVIGYMRYNKNVNMNRHSPMNITIGKKIDPMKLSDVDKVIKKGTKFQRISSKSFEDYMNTGKTIYASFEKKDNRIYMEDMPKMIKQWRSSGVLNDNDNKAYKHVLKMNKDIKVASPRKIAEAYKKATGVDTIEHHKYMNFMTGLSDRDSSSNQKFFDIIRKMGYNAIVDENDAGHYTKTPLILLNPSSDIATSSSKAINRIERILNVILM